MWAAHYSKESAMDAELTVAQMISYPEHPVRPKADAGIYIFIYVYIQKKLCVYIHM